jgi:hypothetical protein
MAWWKNRWVIGGAAGLGVILLGRVVQGSPKVGAVLRAPGVPDYHFTEDDLLWLGRSLHCETGPAGERAVAWAMMQRFVAFRQRDPGRWGDKSFRYLVQMFSAPVNPRWLPGGDLYEANPGTFMVLDRTIVRRRACMARRYSELRSSIRAVLDGIRRSDLSNPVAGFTNFEGKQFEPGGVCQSGARLIGGNCFYRQPPVNGPVRLV